MPKLIPTHAFIIQWRSPKTGYTRCELRRTEEGKDRLIRTLNWLGIPREHIVIDSHIKPYINDQAGDK